jgi:hypothetical protein
MITLARELPSSAASAWAIDLRDARGPMFVVLRASETAARAALVEYLAAMQVADVVEARALVDIAQAKGVAVIW